MRYSDGVPNVTCDKGRLLRVDYCFLSCDSGTACIVLQAVNDAERLQIPLPPEQVFNSTQATARTGQKQIEDL